MRFTIKSRYVLLIAITTVFSSYVSIGIKINDLELSSPRPLQEDTTGNYAVYWILIADTGKNYKKLDAEMYGLEKCAHIPTDTMNRYYNKRKNEIVLSEKDDDEMYRGSYYPRRFTSVNLSLEYYIQYSPLSTEKNIALVTGIYDNPGSADSALKRLRNYAPKSFIQHAKVYIGCMH